MSFAYELKNELCTLIPEEESAMHAFVYGLVLFSRRFSAEEISFSVIHERTAAVYKEAVENYIGAAVRVTAHQRARGTLYNISVPDAADREKILRRFSHAPGETHLRINRANIESDECVPCFLRGAYLVCGALSDPAKDYHIEFDVGYLNLSRDMVALIGEVLATPKRSVRRGLHIVYFKESEHIEDLLTYMSAMKTTVELMNVKIFKDVRNRVNRRTNCETANIDKTVAASAQQVEDIEMIFEQRGEKFLPEELNKLAVLRLDNPELSLRELGEMLNPPLSRSGVNHRLQRIGEIAARLKE